MFHVYAIYNSVHNRIYVGQTKDISDRISAHNRKRKIKSYTSRFEGEWKLIYTESFSTRSEAIKRERQLKTFRGREYIKQHIPG